MIQLPIPEDTARLEVKLPSEFERWRDTYLQEFGEKFVVFLIIALLLYAVMRIARRTVGENIEDVNRRHVLRKWIGYAYAALLVLTGIALFADALEGFGTVLALVLAGVAVALQDVLKSVVGWLYISSRSGVQIGSRIEVNGTVGDVIDVGVLKTTLLEVGNLVYARQSTGRVVTIPNYRLLSEGVFISGAENPFVWQEVQILVTYESDWHRAEAILKEIADEQHQRLVPELERGFRAMERRYAFKYGAVTPIVYVSIEDSGVMLTLRYLSPVRGRRGSVDGMSRRILDAFEAEPAVELAYPTYRIYRAGEELRPTGP